MADNSTQSGTDVIATDDLTALNGVAYTGAKVQRVKVGFGDDGILQDVSLANPLPTENPDLVVANQLSAVGSIPIATAGGNGVVGIQLSGTWVATVVFEATTDAANWFPVNAVASVTGTQVGSTTANGQWRVNSGGYQQVRIRVSSFTSGTVGATLVASGASTMATLAEPLPAGGNVIGTVHDNIDMNRTTVVLSAAGVASVTTVGLITLNQYVGGTVTAGVTTYTVPAGKTFRIQSIQFGSRFTTPSTTVTFASTTFAIRFVTTGTTVVGSPILHQDSKLSASNMPTPNSDMAIPDGLELPAGYNIGVTHLASATGLSEDVAIVGFLY